MSNEPQTSRPRGKAEQRMSGAADDQSADGSLTLLRIEMDRYLAHERRRLRVIAIILAAIGVLVAAGHVRADAGTITVMPHGVDDLLAGYPTAVMLVLMAIVVWRRARI